MYQDTQEQWATTTGADNVKPRILVTDSEIGDKSKGSTIGIGVAALQTAWFVLQYLHRWGSRQPRTQLEVMTLAYITISIMISLLWRNKPRDIQMPIHFIPRTALASHNDDVNSVDGQHITAALHSNRVVNIIKPAIEKMKTLAQSRHVYDAWSSLTHGAKPRPSAAALLVFGVIFGGVHCLAWSSLFSTRPEAILWKVCAVYCAAFYFTILIIAPLGYSASKSTIGNIVVIIGMFLFFGYVVCRVILFVLTFISLRALPPGVYETTNWLSYLPHVG